MSTSERSVDSTSMLQIAISFVVLAVFLLAIICSLGACIGFILLKWPADPRQVPASAYKVVFAVWGGLAFYLLIGLFERVRNTENVSLQTREFFSFQIACALFVILFNASPYYVPPEHIPQRLGPLIGPIGVGLDILVGFVSWSYIAIAYGSGKKVPLKTFLGLLVVFGAIAINWFVL